MRRNIRRSCWLSFAGALLLLACSQSAPAVDQVAFNRQQQRQDISGKLLVTAQDGGLLLLAPDGTLWNIEPDEIVDHQQDAHPFVPLSQSDAAKKVLAELPAGFESFTTAHYVICYGTSRVYAQWVGALYERLYAGFTNYWSHRGFKLHEPELPLIVLVFPDQQSYVKHAKPELGDAVGSIIGYYSLRTNRVTMYDLTGVEALRRAGDRRGSAQEINRMLTRPEAEAMVATIIHEATHQIAFNCGLQTRFADIPLWVSEGIAVYFETPDLNNARGWRTIGEVNRPRLDRFRDYLSRRPTKSLLSLLMNDKRFRDPRQALDAYAEAWALNYFLIKQKPKEYLAYLGPLSAKHALISDPPETRIKQFKAAFGDDLDHLDAEFVKYMRRMK
jgi:hypothetical protein